MELHALILSLLLLTIVSGTEARSLETTFQCATTCTEPENFQFIQGYTYEFTYAATVYSSFQDDGTAADWNSQIGNWQIGIGAVAMIDVLSPCEHVLRITGANIKDNSDNLDKTAWIESVQRHPTHFSWQDGSIPEICASNGEPTWVLNIKRGILSALQISTTESVASIKETDVTGECESSYDVETSDGVSTIVKRKDYNKCENRDKYLLFSHFTPYSSESPRQNFIHSTQTCTQRVRNSQIIGSNCLEEHIFRPFSTAESGARTTVRQLLEYNGRQRYYSGDTLGSNDARRTTLEFENEDESAALSTDISEIQTLFSNICMTMSLEDYTQVGKYFIRMVFLLRRLDSQAIEQAYSSLNGACPTWEDAIKGMFQDALQWCGSEGCVVSATKMIEAGPSTLSDEISSRWLTGMSLITKPTLPMLRGMIAIVQSGRLTEQSFLTTGTMIHRLCEASTTNCMTEPTVTRALELFDDKLGINCRTTNQEQKQDILLALRALGNAGRSTSINKLAACIQEESNDMETRIAAVQSFRRMPCNTDRSSLSTIVFNARQDSELRIASYMAAMKCPTPTFIQQIVILLDDEPVKQMASFVWTHVHQLLESSDPLKGYIKPLLLETEFAKQHDLDPRKYSRFYEASMFSEQLNAGATIESSVVWSPKSFVPRSGQLDLTVDVFGQAVNLLEMGGRVEGVETMLQSFLQSGGFLKNNPLSEMFMRADDDEEPEEEEEEEEVTRVSRETDGTRLVELRREYQAGVNTENTPNANWYLRVFGNEMFYRNTRGMGEAGRSEAMRAAGSIFAQLAQGGEYHYHDDTMLVNSAHVLPTGLGLPLTIAFNGSASIDVNANGNLDMSGLFQTPRNLAVVGTMNPRAVILVVGSMSVDAHATRAGIMTESSAVTSWTVGGRASIENGQSVQVTIDAPQQRNTLFSFNHKLMKINAGEIVNIGNEQVNTATNCSQEFAGQRICMESPSTMAIFPIDGPIAMSTYMEKTDTGFDRYLLEGSFFPEYNGGSYPFQLQTTLHLDTPGSSIDRQTSIVASYSFEEMQFGINFQRPQTNIMLQGQLSSEPMRKQVVITYALNGQQTRFEGSVQRQQDGGETRWTASTSLETPAKTVTGNAEVALDPSSSVSASLSIENMLETPISLSMSLQDSSDSARNRLRYRGNGQVTIPGYTDTGVRFDMNIRPRTDVFVFALNYAFSGQPERSIHILHKRRDHSTSTVTDWEAEQKMTITQFPQFNHHVQFTHSNRPGAISSFAKIGYGRHAGHDDNVKFILVNQTLSYSSESTTEIEGNVDVQIPTLEISYNGNLQHVHNSSSIDTNVRVGTYGMHFFVQDNTPPNGLINKELRMEIPTPWGDLRVQDSIQETSANVYTIRGQFGVGTSRGLSMNGVCDIENLSNRKSITIDVTGDNNQNLLHATSVNQVLQPAGFSSENSIVSRYNNLINMNVRHEGGKQGGFESSILLEHQPDKYLKVDIDYENQSTVSKRLVRVDFKDASGTSRFVQLLANKLTEELENDETRHNASVSFTNDLPRFPVYSLITSGEFSTSPTMYAAGATLNLNEVELFGGNADYHYTIEDDNTGVTSVAVNLRSVAHSIGLTTNVRNTQSQGHAVSATYLQDGETKLTTTFNVNQDATRFEGQASQLFDITSPQDMSFVLTKLSNGMKLRVDYERKTLMLNIVKDLQSVTVTCSHNDASLRDNGVPRSITATLQWGTRTSDNGKGIWLTSTINRRQPLNVEMMYHNENGHVITCILQHQVRDIIESVPQVNAEASLIGPWDSAEMRSSFSLDRELKADFLLNWQSGQSNFHVGHDLEFLSNLNVPRTIDMNSHWSTPSFSQINVGSTLSVDGATTTVTIGTTEDSISLEYFSNCSCISGNFNVNLQIPANEATITLKVTRNRMVKRATVSYTVDSEQQSLSVHMRQNLYEDFEMPNIPAEIRMDTTVQYNHVTFSGRYNDYNLEFDGTGVWVTEANKLVLDSSWSQNIWYDIPSTYEEHQEIEIHPYTSISYITQYTVDGDEGMMKLALALGDDEESEGTKELSAVLRQNEPYLVENGIPTDFKIVLSAKLLQYGLKGSIVSTINQQMRRIDVLGEADTTENVVRTSLTHDLQSLTELGVFRNFTIHVHALPRSDTISMGGFAQIDERNYQVDGSASLHSHPDQSELEIDADFGHDIQELYELGVPLRTATRTNVQYSIVAGDLSGGSSISSTVIRTMLDDETGEEIQLENLVEASADLQLFSWNGAIAGSHDFNIAFLPNKVKYEFAASGSTPASHVFYKSFSMAVTLDGKKQVASVTINQNPSDHSFVLATSHNMTQIYKYGVPGQMSVNFRMRDNYDFDLNIVYDTSKKSIGFKFDYHGDRHHLILLFDHNFDVIVERLGIPKSIGIDTAAGWSTHDADVEVLYIWGQTIKSAHVILRWDASTKFLLFLPSSFSFRHHQNITTDDVFPRAARFSFMSSYDNQGFTSRITSGRNYIAIGYDKETPTYMPYTGTLTVSQNFDTTNYPRSSRFEASLSDNNVLDLSMYFDRELKLHSIITGELNVEEDMYGSVRIENMQELVGAEIFPTNINLYSNASLNNGFATYVRFAQDSLPTFALGFKTGVDMESNSGFVELNHSQREWKKAGLPKKMRVEGSYNAEEDGSQQSVQITLRRGSRRNDVMLGSGHVLSEDSVYGRLSYTHDFDEYREVVPMTGMVNLLLQKSSQSLGASANVTLDEVALIHSFEALYDIDDFAFSASFEAEQDNVYLEPYQIPHTLAGSISSQWESEILGRIATTYGDKMTTLQVSRDQEETTAELIFSHNWSPSPHDVRITLTKSEDETVTLSVYIDGIQKDIHVSGNVGEGHGEFNVMHGFEGVDIPQEVRLQGTYRLQPDMHLSLNAELDGVQHSIAAGFNKLDDGFHITSTLLDDVTREATFRQNFVPGGFSVELDHNIPELLTHVPGSIALSASGRVNPRPNVTASFRQQAEARVFTAETDLNALRLSVRHDFEMLPLPRTLNLEMSGSTTPLHGSISLELDGTTRLVSADVDPENLAASLLHNIPEVPLPNTLRVSVRGSASPPSGSISVTIDDIVRSASAEVDMTNMEGRMSHTIPELDSVFVPRDMIVGVKGSVEPLSGEIYVSLDGLERRVGGMLNGRGMTASMFHTIPEVEYVPRNITVSVKGSMEPLSGSIVLTIDEVERSIEGEMNSRGPSVDLSHTIPEADSYIPRHLSVSVGLTDTSGQATVSYTKNERDRTVSVGVNYNVNHIRALISHNFEEIDMPQDMAIELSGSIEHKNVTISTSAGTSFVNLNGEILSGEDGWYGVSIGAQHNIITLYESLNMPRNMEVMGKVRQNDNSYESAVILNVLDNHDFTAAGSVTPTKRSKRAGIQVTYDHTYNGRSRSVSGSVTALKRSGQYKLMIDGRQTDPEPREIHFSSAASSDVTDQYQYTVELEASHNLPELTAYGVPNNVENGQIAITVIPEELTVRGEANVALDQQPKAYSFDVRVQPSKTDFALNGDVIIDNSAQNNVYSAVLSTHHSLELDDVPLSVSLQFSTTGRNNGLPSRDDDVTVSLTIAEDNVDIRMIVQQPELNELGLPAQTNISMRRLVADISCGWELHATLDDMSLDYRTNFLFQRDPIHLNYTTSFDHSISFLERFHVPTHVSYTMMYNMDSSEERNPGSAFVLEYNDYRIMYNGTCKISDSEGVVESQFEHNIPTWREAIGYNKVVERYAYTINDNVMTLNGRIIEDDSTNVGNYELTWNYETKELTYSGRYNDNGYNFVYQYHIERKNVSIHVMLNNVESTLFLLNIECNSGGCHLNITNQLIGTPFDFSHVMEKNNDGCRCRTAVTVNGGDYRTVVLFVPYDENELTGKVLSLEHEKRSSYSLDAALTVGVNKDQKSGLAQYVMTNKRAIENLPKKTQFTASHNAESSLISFASGRKRLSMHSTVGVVDEIMTVETTLYNSHISLLKSWNVPGEIRSTISMRSVTVVADEVTVVRARLNQADYVFAIFDLNGEQLCSLTGAYTTTQLKSFDATFICHPMQLDLSVAGELKMFEAGTGNSSLTFSVTDNARSEQLDFTAYANPTSVHYADFMVVLVATSDIAFMPFDNKLKFVSSFDEDTRVYTHDFDGSYYYAMVSFDGEYRPNEFSVELEQPWFTATPVMTLSGSTNIGSDGAETKTLSLQWGEEEDSLTIQNIFLSRGTVFSNALHVTQPSTLYVINDFGASFYVGFMQSQTYKFGVNSNVNQDQAGMNVTYTGILPQMYGTHNLQVDVKQPILGLIPSQFTTTGVVTIGSTGTYISDWHITSDGQEVAVLTKHYLPSESGLSMSLLWKQSYYQNVPIRYLSMSSTNVQTDSSFSSTGRIQMDDMPEMTGKVQFGSESDDDRSNTSVSIDVASGPLSRWLMFRTMSSSAWYKSETDTRQTAPAFSVTVDVDGQAYHVECSSRSISSSRTSRFDIETVLSHPLDLMIFNTVIPKASSGTFNILSRESGSRMVATYNNELMENPFKITSNYLLNNGDVPFEANVNVKFGPEAANDDITLRMNVANNDNGLDHVMTMSMQYPESGLNREIVIGGVNSADTLGCNVMAKDYAGDEVQTWEVRLSFRKATNTIELYLNSPEIEPTTLRGDLSQVLGQGRQLLQRLAADATSMELRFVKGIEKTTDGYDMFIGYDIDGDATYTLHLLVGVESDEAFAALQTKRNFELVSEVARASVRLADARLVQLRLSANPTIVKFFQKAISKFDAKFTRKINRLADNLVEFVGLFKTVVSGNQGVETATNAYIDGIIAKINAVRDFAIRLVSGSASKSSSRFDTAGSVAEQNVRAAITTLLDAIDSSKSVILRPFVELRDEYYGEIIQRINAALLRKLQPVTALLRKAHAGELFIELVEEATQNTVNYLLANGEASLIALRRPLSDLLVVTDTEILFNIPLEFDVDHFVPLPTLDDVKMWLVQSALAIKIDDAVNMLYSYADEYYKARSLLYIPRDEILPPFKGHSFVSGFRHFSTFDKRHFDFSSGCATSHILAADLRDGNFTVAISYADPSQSNSLNSIEVIVGNRYVVIYSDYKVEINRRVKQLPLDLNVLTVMLEGTVVHIRRAEGDMDVACDFTKELCTVDVSPFYFGATAGLAGVYNNEPMDDFTGPTHDLLDDQESLASAWESSGAQCGVGNTYTSCDSNSLSATCSAMFEDLNSPMRACFPLVDAAPFMKQCRDDMCNTENTAKSCSAAHAYAYRCKLAGVPLILPDHCVVCSDVRGTEFDASQRQSATVTALDVVLVVEEGSCMSRGGLYKSMRKFYKRLGGAFSDARMRNNRFYLVGYGGPGQRDVPHTFTIRSQPFTLRKGDVVKTIRKMSLKTEASHADSLSAISYASQLPFRAGAKPVILLLSCDQCSSTSQVSYADVEWQLRKQGALLYHMPPKTILAGSSSKHMYGFDDTNAFSRTRAVSNEIIKPSKSDMCVQLATVTGGSVWDATQLSESDFVAKLSSYIVSHSGSRTQQTCTCSMNEYGIPSSICTV